MTEVIRVQRIDYPAHTRTINRRTNKTVTVPARYECYYYWNGEEIAYYRSDDNTVYLRTDYLGKPISRDYMGRMKKAPRPEMWADLSSFFTP